MKREARLHRAIGEARAGIYESGKLVEVHIARHSDRNLPHPGERWTGRVRRIEPSLGAAFVDMGTPTDGFLRFTTSPGAPRLTEGQLLDVTVARETEPGKGPLLTYAGKPTHENPAAVTQLSLQDRLDARFPVVTTKEGRVPRLTDLVQTELAIPGGGTVAIEPTRALVAVDVDKGTQVSGLKAGEAAATLIAQQLRLRGLGGLVCIDFPNLRQPKQRSALEKAVTRAFSDDPDKPKIAPLSRFGVVELTRTRRARSLDSLLADTPVETAALEALDQLLAEGKARPGAQLTLTVTPELMSWLDATDLDWRGQLTERLGARFIVREGESISVEADR